MRRPVVVFAFLLLSCSGEAESTNPVGAAGGSSGAAGNGGSGGSGNAGGAAGNGAWTECYSDTECQLHSDCCNCLGLKTGETPPSCALSDCTQTTCESLGVKAVRCQARRCVLDANCVGDQAICAMVPPSCPADQVPLLTPAGTCWTGQCLSALECSAVTSCTQCNSATQICVDTGLQHLQQHSYHCLPIPAACSSTPDCSCLGKDLCGEHMTCDRYQQPSGGIYTFSCTSPDAG